MNKEERKEVASKLKAKRLKLGHTQDNCAVALGVHGKQIISNIECGISIPHQLVSKAIAEYLKL